MKHITIAWILLLSTTLYAQNYISAGFAAGVSNYRGYTDGDIMLKTGYQYEFGDFKLGGLIGLNTSRESMLIGIKADYIFLRKNTMEFYAGITGIAMEDYRETFLVGPQAGMLIMFNRFFGFYTELGYGPQIWSTGIVVKF